MPVRGKTAETAFMQEKYFILYFLYETYLIQVRGFFYLCKRHKSNWHIVTQLRSGCAMRLH